jgi:hypothetical protein
MKRFLIASPVLLTAAIVAFYGIANWYGERAVQEEVAAMKAAGWPVTLEETLGPPPKPEEDLFQHPAMLREFSLRDKERLQALPNLAGYGVINGISKRSIGWESTPALGKMSDVRLLADPARPGDPEEQVAKELLLLIEGQSQRFDEMKTAFARPGADWVVGNVRSFNRPIQLQRLTYFIQHRARLRLAAGESTLAFEDVEAMTDLTGIMRRSAPCLMSFFLASFMEANLSKVIWEGIKRKAWNESQLAHLQHRFEGTNRAHNFRRMAREELAGVMGMKRMWTTAWNQRWDQVGQTIWEGVQKRDYGKFPEAWLRSWAIVRPQGLTQLEIRDQIAAFRTAADWLVETPAGRTAAELNRDMPRSTRWEPIPLQYPRALERYFDTEANRVLLRTGIALERYRLKHRAMPGKLEDLVPEFLPEAPKDIYDGQPLRYEVLPDGAPHVWSIWPSGKDEGGIPSSHHTNNTVWTTGQIPGLTEAIYNAR